MHFEMKRAQGAGHRAFYLNHTISHYSFPVRHSRPRRRRRNSSLFLSGCLAVCLAVWLSGCLAGNLTPNNFRDSQSSEKSNTFVIPMRATTKLKLLLIRYSVQLDLNEEEQMVLTLSDKVFGEHKQFIGATYSVLIGKAYSFMLRTIKEEEKRQE